MSEWAPNVAGRLEEIDRRLREIQAELVPGRVPRETRVPVNPSESDPSQEPHVDPVGRPEEAVAETDEAVAQTDSAARDDSDEAGDRPRGRSGPLAEALQRARMARIAGLTAPHEASPEQSAPDPMASQPAPAESRPAVAEEPPSAAEEPPSAAEEPPRIEPPPPPVEPPPPAEPPLPPVDEPLPPAAGPPPPPEPEPEIETPRYEPPAQARPGHPQPPPVHELRRAAARSDPRVDVLAQLQSSLLTATRDLLDGYERASFTASESRANRVTISAGPFSGTESLRAFEQKLSRLPGVRDVDLRGYEGPDRAIIEVELEEREER